MKKAFRFWQEYALEFYGVASFTACAFGNIPLALTSLSLALGTMLRREFSKPKDWRSKL